MTAAESILAILDESTKRAGGVRTMASKLRLQTKASDAIERRDLAIRVAVKALSFCENDSTDPVEDQRVAQEALQKIAEILEGRS